MPSSRATDGDLAGSLPMPEGSQDGPEPRRSEEQPKLGPDTAVVPAPLPDADAGNGAAYCAEPQGEGCHESGMPAFNAPPGEFSQETHAGDASGGASRRGFNPSVTYETSERIKWTAPLHDLFVRCTNESGGPMRAKPKTIVERMDVAGLSINHVKSHLQKYRLGFPSWQQTQPSSHTEYSGDGKDQPEPKRPRISPDDGGFFNVGGSHGRQHPVAPESQHPSFLQHSEQQAAWTPAHRVPQDRVLRAAPLARVGSTLADCDILPGDHQVSAPQARYDHTMGFFRSHVQQQQPPPPPQQQQQSRPFDAIPASQELIASILRLQPHQMRQLVEQVASGSNLQASKTMDAMLNRHFEAAMALQADLEKVLDWHTQVQSHVKEQLAQRLTQLTTQHQALQSQSLTALFESAMQARTPGTARQAPSTLYNPDPDPPQGQPRLQRPSEQSNGSDSNAQWQSQVVDAIGRLGAQDLVALLQAISGGR